MGHVLSGFWRDLKFGMRLIRVLRLFSDLDPRSHDTITQDIEGTVDRSPEAIAFFFEGRTFTYRNIDQRANRVAQWALGQNLRRGDCVALNLENCPDFVIVWYGLSKVGVICALINTNLKDEGLEHCIRIVDAKAVISAGLQAERSLSCLKACRSLVNVWDFDGANGRDFEAARRCYSQTSDAWKAPNYALVESLSFAVAVSVLPAMPCNSPQVSWLLTRSIRRVVFSESSGSSPRSSKHFETSERSASDSEPRQSCRRQSR